MKVTIQRRFSVRVEKNIEADNLHEALEVAHDAQLTDFLTVNEDVGLIDYESLPGTGVLEVW